LAGIVVTLSLFFIYDSIAASKDYYFGIPVVIFISLGAIIGCYESILSYKKQHIVPSKHTEQTSQNENTQLEKIKNARTGQPITLSGYAVFDRNGNDTGKRFIRKEDAIAYANAINPQEIDPTPKTPSKDH